MQIHIYTKLLALTNGEINANPHLYEVVGIKQVREIHANPHLHEVVGINQWNHANPQHLH